MAGVVASWPEDRNRANLDECWTVGLRHPLEPHLHIAEFHLRNRSLGTAGGATQNFEAAGKKYGHILDPRTGWPAEGILYSDRAGPHGGGSRCLGNGVLRIWC